MCQDRSAGASRRARLRALAAAGAAAGLLGFVPPGAAVPEAPQSPTVIIRQVDTYPRDGETRVPADATVHFVFDQPTLKTGSFSVCDLDTTVGNQCVTLSERWSALGDTVFLKPIQPMTYGHRFGMRVGTIRATDLTYTSNLPIVYFTVIARASLKRVPGGTEGRSLALTPGVPTPVGFTVQETAGTAAEIRSVRIEIFSDPADPATLPFAAVPIHVETRPLSISVGRLGLGSMETSVTVPREVARDVPGGQLGLRLTFEGTDETGLPIAVASFSPVIATSGMASNLVIDSAFLESPQHGIAIAAGDTLRPRAVVTGAGTGAFRAAFFIDGDLVAIEEGYIEAGRPATVTMRGPLPTRRLGEHRLMFSVESPQRVDARPISFVCVTPPGGLTAPRSAQRLESPPAPAGRLSVRGSWIADGRSRFRSERGSAVGWAAWSARYDLGSGRSLEAETSWRVRFDSTANGSGAPQQLRLRFASSRAALEWADAPPALALESPLLASPVPHRGAQARWRGTPLGDLESFVAIGAHPRSAGGPANELASDLYAARLTRAFRKDALRASLYGGYTHEEPTPGGGETSVRARAIYGGTARLRLPRGWTLLADAATVRHRAISGVETGRSRTAWRGELAGGASGVAAKAEVFSYQPDLLTALNPYALSNRRGGQIEVSRPFLTWSLFGAFRTEQPTERLGLMPLVRVDRIRLGGRLSLNQTSFVSPALVRVTHRGANTRFTENRFATELDLAEPHGGRTTARFDVTLFEDELGVRTRRRNVSGSLVSTRRHPGRITSTLAAGLEREQDRDAGFTNRTTQGSVEFRWEALPSRLLVSPFVSYSNRDLEGSGYEIGRISGRLQVAWLRVPRLGENAIAVEGRVDRIEQVVPLETTDTEGSVLLTIGHSFRHAGAP